MSDMPSEYTYLTHDTDTQPEGPGSLRSTHVLRVFRSIDMFNQKTHEEAEGTADASACPVNGANHAEQSRTGQSM